jgi:Flp pilus assembly protein TadG
MRRSDGLFGPLRFAALVRDRRGTAAVEMALTSSGLFAFIFGIMQFGYALWMQNALDYSVATAARCAALNCSADIAAYAAAASGADFASSVFTPTSPDPSCGKQVSGSYAMTIPVPFVSDFSVTLTAQACYPI